jgi:hypothetical protein
MENTYGKLGYTGHNIDIQKKFVDARKPGMEFDFTYRSSDYNTNRTEYYGDSQGYIYPFYLAPFFFHWFKTGRPPEFVVLGSEWGCSTNWNWKGQNIIDLAVDESSVYGGTE